MGTEVLRVGDTVSWRHNWGSGPLVSAKVTGLEQTEYPREKYGVGVLSVSWDTVRKNRVLVVLGEKWAYSSQISPSGTDPREWHTL